MDRPAIYTIGHSNVAPRAFLDRLGFAGVEVVVDVRSRPSSRYNSHFNRATLATTLKQAGIRYSFLGHLLGGRPADDRYYDPDGHVRYDLWSASAEFRQGIELIERAAVRHRLALMCAEANPAKCHRHLLIARVLTARGWPRSAILHITGDGEILPDDAIPDQPSLLGGDAVWRSPLSVLHRVRPSGSSND